MTQRDAQGRFTGEQTDEPDLIREILQPGNPLRLLHYDRRARLRQLIEESGEPPTETTNR